MVVSTLIVSLLIGTASASDGSDEVINLTDFIFGNKSTAGSTGPQVITPEGIYTSGLTSAENTLIQDILSYTEGQVRYASEILTDHPDLISEDAKKIAKLAQQMLEEQSNLMVQMASAIAKIKGYTPLPLFFIDPGYGIYASGDEHDSRGDIVTQYGDESDLIVWWNVGTYEVDDERRGGVSDGHTECDIGGTEESDIIDCGGEEWDSGDYDPDGEDIERAKLSCVPTLDWYRIGVPHMNGAPEHLSFVREFIESFQVTTSEDLNIVIRADRHTTVEGYTLPQYWSIVRVDGEWGGIHCGSHAIGPDDVRLQQAVYEGSVDTAGGIDRVLQVDTLYVIQ